MTDLKQLRQGWNIAAREDAMFNILTIPGKENGGWTLEEFMAHGREEIDKLEGKFSPSVRALDFGCGIGRLTHALAEHFMYVDGVDISDEMIAIASEINQDPDRISFHVSGEDLSLFKDDTFDFVYTMIVLQHCPPELSEVYVKEFVRVLKPGGIAMFNLPDGPIYQHPEPWLSMYPVPWRTVLRWTSEAGARLLDADDTDPLGQWRHWRYRIEKPE